MDGFVYLAGPTTARARRSLENTYCPNCGTLLIERWGLGMTGYHLERGHCARREIQVGWICQDGLTTTATRCPTGCLCRA
jgi:hypothetical protein